MSRIRFGCQTYTWQMSGETFKDRLGHIIEVGGRAGFAGIEPEVVMLGRLADPFAMKDALQARRMILGALALAEDWRGPRETTQERANADRVFAFLAHFPGTMLMLCQMPGAAPEPDPVRLRERQKNLLLIANEIARRASARGIACSYHPNSPPGSIFRTAADYEILLDGLEAGIIDFTPDVGHIVRGGMDPLAIIKKYRDRVTHLHFKDARPDGQWAAMGEGSIDFSGIVSYLHDTGFSGWIMVEDECALAEENPDGATLANGVYVREKLVPLLRAVRQDFVPGVSP